MKLPTIIFHCCTHKTASQWFKDLFSDDIVTNNIPLNPYQYWNDLPEGTETRSLMDRNFDGFNFPRNIIATPIYCSFQNYCSISKPEFYRSFFVLRDPRDIVVSWYYSMKETHTINNKGMKRRREKLQTLSKKKGLSWSIKKLYRDDYFEAQKSWYENYSEDPNLKLLRFEKFFGNDTFRSLKKLFEHLNLPLNENEMSHLFERHRFERKQKQNDRYRNGEPGNWKKHLKKDHLHLLQELTDDITTTLDYNP
jgi:hypothetical protein